MKLSVLFGVASTFVLAAASAAAMAHVDPADSAAAFRTSAPAAATDWTPQHATADDGLRDDRFGTSVAVSGDLAVIGAFDAKVGDNYNQGAAYVFTREGGLWSQAQKLVASDGAGMANFGAAVAIAGDTILVGAIGANVGGHSNQGAVYAFAATGGVWSETQKLVAGDGGSGDTFGNAIATDGTTVLVGAKGATVGGHVLQGKAYVFTSRGGHWTQGPVLSAADGAGNDLFGHALAIDGATAVIGAPTFTYNFKHAGFVYVFTADGGTWSQAQKIVPTTSALGDQFGYAVGLAGDTLIATSTGNAFAHGAAYVFTPANGAWTQTQQLVPDPTAGGDEFGNVMAMHGATAVIGAQRLMIDDHQGAAFVFSATNGTWNQTDVLTESAGTNLDFFGGAVAFDGATALVGIPGATIAGAQFQGAAAFYRAPMAPPIAVVSTDALSLTVAAGANAATTFSIGNDGGGDLTFALDEAIASCPAPGDVVWLAASPAAGTIAAGATQSIDVTVDASALAPGEHSADLCIATNDPAHARVPVAVTVTVAPDDIVFANGFDA